MREKDEPTARFAIVVPTGPPCRATGHPVTGPVWSQDGPDASAIRQSDITSGRLWDRLRRQETQSRSTSGQLTSSRQRSPATIESMLTRLARAGLALTALPLRQARGQYLDSA
jgi:hypothetical protein